MFGPDGNANFDLDYQPNHRATVIPISTCGMAVSEVLMNRFRRDQTSLKTSRAPGCGSSLFTLAATATSDSAAGHYANHTHTYIPILTLRLA